MKNIKIFQPDCKLVTLCKIKDAVEADLMRITLLDHQIDAKLGNEHQGGFAGLAQLQVGVLVREQDLSEAAKIVAIHHPPLLK